MSFRLNSTVHFGYLRPPGIYDDLSPAEQAALAKYGAPEPDPAQEEKPREPEVPERTRPDDSAGRQAGQESREPAAPVLACAYPGCFRAGKAFPTAAALKTHRTAKGH